jgi:hypothetical protein
METTSFKALSLRVLERNRQGNRLETSSFLDGKPEEEREEAKETRPKPYPIPESIIRPDDYKRLEGWRLELFQLVVWSAMEGPKKRTREEAERIAWADVDRNTPTLLGPIENAPPG